MRDRRQALREDVAEEVRALMARRRTSQIALAHALDMGQSSLSRRLNADHAFDLDELELIAEFFDVPITDLLGGSRYGGGRAKGALLKTPAHSL